tara:strand:- start:371 stop:1315 length:945 start_codon:yes stop_codon:yes gene_type:complete
MNPETLAIVISYATPLVFAVIGETITEKSGVVNLSLDGSMLLSAMTGFAVSFATGNVVLGLIAGGLVSSNIALIVAFSSIRLRLNQIAVGIVLTLLAAKLAAFLGQDFVRKPGPSVQDLHIPVLGDIPGVGPILFQQNLLVYFSYILVGLSFWFIFYTRQGLNLQAAGERPEAAYARGIDVNKLRYFYTALGGFLVGLGGAAFSLDVKLGWSDGHIINFGWIALAIVIFGGWHPIRAALGCYLFGILQLVALKLQPVLPQLSQVLPITPFPLMIMTLLFINHRKIQYLLQKNSVFGRFITARAPSALGESFQRL